MRVLFIAILLFVFSHPVIAQADQDEAVYSDTPLDASQIAYPDTHTNDNPILRLTYEPLSLPLLLPIYADIPPPLSHQQPRIDHAFPADEIDQRTDGDQ